MHTGGLDSCLHAWRCYPTLPRADGVCLLCSLQVLSVVAQQVLEIQLAVKAKMKTFTFEGSELTMRPSCNVFM